MAQTAPGPGAQTECHQLRMGLGQHQVIRKEGEEYLSQHSQAGVGIGAQGQSSQHGQELTRQGHRYTTSGRAHPPGNEGQQCPQDAEVIDEEKEVTGWL